jgi:hypothetical protein
MMAANILSRPQTTATVTVSCVFYALHGTEQVQNKYTTHTRTLTMMKFKRTTHAKMLKFKRILKFTQPQDIVSSQPSNPSSSHGRRLRVNLTSSHSVLSQSSYVSSNTLAERSAEGQQQLLHKQEVLRQDIEESASFLL